MASNFSIFWHQNSDNLHLKLSGDFDGSSAHELIHMLKNRARKARNIYIHTSSLSDVHPFGLDVFQKNCALHGLTQALIFTGKYARTMSL